MSKTKKIQSTEDVMILPWRERVSISSQCTARRRVWVDKVSSRITDGYLQRLVESWGQIQTPITTCCLRGFQEKYSSLIQKQTPAYSVVRHDWNFKRDPVLSTDEKKELFGS